MFTTVAAARRAWSMSPSVRCGFGQSVRTATSNLPSRVWSRWYRSTPGRNTSAAGVLHRAVSPEVELRRDPEVEVVTEPPADETPGAPERGKRRRPLVLVAEHRDEDPRHAKVFRGLDLGHRDESEPRVLELPLEQGGDLLFDELIHAVEPLALHQRTSTNVSMTRPSTLSSMNSIALATTS